MTLLTPAALIALVLLPLIVLLHLRRRRYQPADVPSLIIWREVFAEATSSGGRLSVPFPLLLLLQLLAVAALVLSLARPEGAATPRHQQIYVLDDSYGMAATDVQPSRLAAARRAIEERIDRATSDTLFTVVLASAQPSVLISSGDRAQVRRALDAVTPSTFTADLPAALRLAAGSLLDPRGRAASVLVTYAREETLPTVSGTLAAFSSLPVGQNSRNQALVQLSARCASAARPTCMAYAAVRNEGDRPITVPVVVEGDGAVLAEPSLQLPAGSDTGLSFPVPAGTRTLRIYIASRDLLSLDNAAWATVPSAPRAQVTLVGDAARVAPVRQALAALPGVRVRVLPPSRYAQARRTAGDLLILDGWLPRGALPPVPALLLIDPPRLPGGSVGGTLADTTISGVDATSDLLANLDLASLDINAGAARYMALPGGVSPVVWSASGPLLAAGSASGQRVAIIAFEPSSSNLPQLSAFPVLLQNILSWSMDWLPASAAAGSSISIDAPPGTAILQINGAGMPGSPGTRQLLHPTAGNPTVVAVSQPGLYTIVERGVWGTRTGTVAVNLDLGPATTTAASTPIAFGSPSPAGAQPAPASTTSNPWWPWIGLVALLLIVAEWLYVAFLAEGA
jgi:hypothetical protein